jgi:hypothetical protein
MSVDIDVVYYYFTVDQNQMVTSVNYTYDNPDGPFMNHGGDFNSFKMSNPGYLFIPVPHSALPN